MRPSLVFARSAGSRIASRPRSTSDHDSPKTSSRLAAVRTNSCTAGPKGKPTAAAASQMVATSSFVRTRSRLVSGAGFSTCAAGSLSMMSRAAAQRNSRFTWASVRLAMILAPRSAMPSISAIMSRFRMSSIGREPQSGSTSRRMTRSTSCRDRLPAWSRRSHSSITVEMIRAWSAPRPAASRSASRRGRPSPR